MSKKLAIGIDLGATNLKGGLVDCKGNIVKYFVEKTKKKGNRGMAVTSQVISLVEKLLEFYREGLIEGIGISSIGPLDYKRGGINHSPNIPFKFIPLIKPLKKRFSLPIYFLNDCLAAVLAEKHFGGGKNFANIVYITISSGIGGGVIVDNHLLFGRGGNASEIGHMIVETKYRIKCSCERGYFHWESFCSGNNLPKFFRYWLKKNKKKVEFSFKNSKDIFEAAEKGNKLALYFIKEVVGKINAHGISNVIVAYDPEIIILGGAVVLNNKNLILQPIRKYIDKFLTPPKIRVTSLGEKIGVIGAASLVFYPLKR